MTEVEVMFSKIQLSLSNSSVKYILKKKESLPLRGVWLCSNVWIRRQIILVITCLVIEFHISEIVVVATHHLSIFDTLFVGLSLVHIISILERQLGDSIENRPS